MGQEKVKDIQGGDVILGSIKCISQTPVELPSGTKGDNHQSEDRNRNIVDGEVTYQPGVSIDYKGGFRGRPSCRPGTEALRFPSAQ